MRLCMSVGMMYDVKFKENGRFTIEGTAAKSMSYYIQFGINLTKNMTEAFFAESHEECLERFRLNQSDFSLNRFSIHDTSGKYSAPVPSYSSSLNIVSGYNLHTYEQEQHVFSKKMPSVLHNFASYSNKIYVLTALFMLSLFLIIWTNVFIVQKRCCLKRTVRKALKYFITFIMNGSDRWYLPSLVLTMGLFLLVTPFCILFKTKQVVVDEPPMITNYRKIIDQRVQMIYTGLGTNESDFFKLGSNSRHANSMNEILEYFHSNSRLFKLEVTPHTHNLLLTLSKGIVQGKNVIIGSDEVTEPMRQLFCSWTLGDDLYQMLSFRDPKQEEIILGFIFGRYPSKNLVKRLRHTFEAHIPSVLLKIFDNYEGIELLLTSPEHRQRQLFLCQQRTLIAHRKEEVSPTDLSFFLPFFATLLVPILTSITLFRVELATGHVLNQWARRLNSFLL